jgi:hypothetical protein
MTFGTTVVYHVNVFQLIHKFLSKNTSCCASSRTVNKLCASQGVSQVVRHWVLTADPWVQSQETLCEIHGG